MDLKRRRTAARYLLLFLASALLLLLMSTCSPLYPLNPWPDANCFMTVGRGMRAGLVPYRDLMDQKGPLLYALHMFASYASGAGWFFGAYLLEIAALTAFLIAAYRMLAGFFEDARPVVPLLIALAALMLASLSFGYGDSAEELCLPLMAWSLCDALSCIRDGGEPDNGCLLRNGVLAGCVLWIKYSLLGLHFAWMAFFAIDCLARRRGFLRAVRMCMIFLAGMALTALPWLIYFGVNGALGDLIQVYFIDNLTKYRGGGSLLRRYAHAVLDPFAVNGFAAVFTAAGTLFVLRSKRFNARARICLVGMIACTFAFNSLSGKRYVYMLYVWSAFAPLGLLPVLWALERGGGYSKRNRAILLALALCVSGLSMVNGNMVSRIGYSKEDLPQVEFAGEMRRVENPRIINCGFLDSGFYLAADALPGERWFCGLNMMRDVCMEAQKRYIESGEADYVVMRDRHLEDYGISAAKYEIVMEREDMYNAIEEIGTYRLYRRRDIA